MAQLNFITVSVGPKYGPEYVNALYKAVCKHYTGVQKWAFYCVTDQPADKLEAGIRIIRPLESIEVPGWWNKLYLFTPLMPKGRLCYMDLDLVVVGDFGSIVDGYDGEFMGDEDHIHFGSELFKLGDYANNLPPIDCSLGTAFVVMDSGFGRHIWRHYISNQDFVHRVFKRHGDQVYISWQLNGKFDLLERLRPDDHGFASYKFNIKGEAPENAINSKQMKVEDCRFINFHGDPKPRKLKYKPKWLKEALFL